MSQIAKVIPFCDMCIYKIEQRNLFDREVHELVGCIKMSKECWDDLDRRLKKCPAIREE
ncbi:hypothetical protein ACFLQL_00415 [Verrucomicrobiota bacterium]